jgi:hypothetical protein
VMLRSKFAKFSLKLELESVTQGDRPDSASAVATVR